MISIKRLKSWRAFIFKEAGPEMKNRLLKRQYAVAVARKQDGKDYTELKYHVIKNGINYWVADPFPIEVEGVLYIFGEVFGYTKNKGSIGYTKLVDGKFTPWKTVIEEEYHLSFPNISYENGKFVICPEANESNSIYLYRCERFPDKWIKDKVIIEGGNYVDTVYYEQNDKSYGITYDVSGGNRGNTLRLFSVDKGKFSDREVKNAEPDHCRPAGKIYMEADKAILPTQIGVPTYGAGIVINECVMNWPDMELRPLRKLYPKDFTFDINKEYAGIHTLNFTEQYVVVDVKWYGFNVINNVFKVIRRIKGTTNNRR